MSLGICADCIVLLLAYIVITFELHSVGTRCDISPKVLYTIGSFNTELSFVVNDT